MKNKEKELTKTLLITVLRSQEESKIVFTDELLRPTMTIDGIQHKVMAVRAVGDFKLEANIHGNLWANISFDKNSNGYVNPEILTEYVKIQISHK